MKVNILLLLIILLSCSTEPNDPEKKGNLISSMQHDPDVSRDGEFICFSGSYNEIEGIHIITNDGNYIKNLFHNNGTIYTDFPSWGKEDESIIFSIEGNIHTIDTSGYNLQVLTEIGQDFFCEVSNNGEYIAYTKTICDPECGIALYNFSADSSKVIHQYGGKPSWFNNNEIYFSTNIFLPVIGSNHRTTYEGFLIQKINIYTEKIDTIYKMNTKKHDLQDLTVSPKGNVVLFTLLNGIPPQFNIWKLNLANNKLEQLTFEGGRTPSWFPNGEKIVYTNTKLSEGGLWVMDLNGNNKKQLTKMER